MGRPCRYQSGQIYGRYKVIEKVRDGGKNDSYLAECLCGKVAVLATTQLKNNKFGCNACRAKLCLTKRPTLHGCSGGSKKTRTREYSMWGR